MAHGAPWVPRGQAAVRLQFSPLVGSPPGFTQDTQPCVHRGHRRELKRAQGPGAPRAGRADWAQTGMLRLSGTEGWAGCQRRDQCLGGVQVAPP